MNIRKEEREWLARCRLEAYLKGYDVSAKSYEGLRSTRVPGQFWDINTERYIYSSDDAAVHAEFNEI